MHRAARSFHNLFTRRKFEARRLSSLFSARLLQAFLVASRERERARAARQIKDTRYSLALLRTFPPAPEITRPELVSYSAQSLAEHRLSSFHYAFRTVSSIAPRLMASRETCRSSPSKRERKRKREPTGKERRRGIYTGINQSLGNFWKHRGENGCLDLATRGRSILPRRASASASLVSGRSHLETSRQIVIIFGSTCDSAYGVYRRNELVTEV